MSYCDWSRCANIYTKQKMIPIRDNIHCNTTPYVSWAIMACCIVIFIAMKSMPDEIQRQLTYLYGMVPIRYSNPEWAAGFGLPPDGYFSFLSSLYIRHINRRPLHDSGKTLTSTPSSGNNEEKTPSLNAITRTLTSGLLCKPLIKVYACISAPAHTSAAIMWHTLSSPAIISS